MSTRTAVLTMVVGGLVLADAGRLAAQTRVPRELKPVGAVAPGGARSGAAFAPPVVSVTSLGSAATLVWFPVTASAPVYQILRTRVDPATGAGPVETLPAQTLVGPDGKVSQVDRAAGLHAPVWYKVVATSSGWGSSETAWIPRQPVAHRGVDLVRGTYLRVPPTATMNTTWEVCLAWAAVPGADAYQIKLRAGAAGWIDRDQLTQGLKPMLTGTTETFTLLASKPPVAQPLFAALEAGSPLEVQVTPYYFQGKYDPSAPQWIEDANHLPAASQSVIKVTAPTPAACSVGS